MLKWCAYCQHFIHEVAPYDDFSMTHGLCPSCMSEHENPFAADVVERAHALRKTFCALFDAGRHEDFETATQIVDEAIGANCRPVDILLGMVSPMLYEIGEEWKRGALSVEAEHRFTDFSKKVVELVETRIDDVMSIAPAPAARIFLMNAPGNRHDLALRILSIWLGCRGVTVRIIEEGVDQAELVRSIAAEKPLYLLISMALTDQRDCVAGIAETVQALPHGVRPRIIVGGYPVKAGLIRAVPGAELLSDIAALEIA